MTAGFITLRTVMIRLAAYPPRPVIVLLKYVLTFKPATCITPRRDETGVRHVLLHVSCSDHYCLNRVKIVNLIRRVGQVFDTG